MQIDDITVVKMDIKEALDKEDRQMKELEREILELCDLQVEIGKLIVEQREKSESAEDNSKKVDELVMESGKILNTMNERRYSGYNYLIMGTSIGMMVGSPFGVLLAVKYGIISGVGLIISSSLLGGYFGKRIIHN